MTDPSVPKPLDIDFGALAPQPSAPAPAYPPQTSYPPQGPPPGYPPQAEEESAPPLLPPSGPLAGHRDAQRLIPAFEELKRGIKRLVFNKHRIDEYASYLESAWRQLDAYLAEHQVLELKLEVSTILVGDTPVLEDDKRENNIVYPLWNEGVRLLTLRHGISVKDLVRFFTVVLDVFPRDPSEDLLSALWKAELHGLEWVALADFSIVEGEEGEEVEVQVEDILKYLQDALTSEVGQGVATARVNFSDLELKLNDVAQMREITTSTELYSDAYKDRIQHELFEEEARLLDKICSVMFEVMQLEASPDELDDIAAALEQLLDGLVLQGKFGTINRVIDYSEMLSRQGHLHTANREVGRRISERLSELIAMPERVRGVATALNAGKTHAMDELKAYLSRLGPTAAVMLLETLDMLTSPIHRRAVADALAEVGRNAVPLFAIRLKKASSNLAKDLFYVIDKINPPDKAQILEPILNHENAVLRMEVLGILSKEKDEKAFNLLRKVFEAHPVPQMRAHAARVMSNMPEQMSVPVLIKAVKDEKFDERPEQEQRAVMAALAQLEHPSARSYIQSIVAEKSGILKARRIDERKLLLVKALVGLPGIPSLKLLGSMAQDGKTHSKEVTEAARDAALKMRDRLTGTAPS